MCIYVKHDPAVRVSQELLYGLHISPFCLEQRTEGVAKSMPTDVLDSGLITRPIAR